jgi:hypothetical protein
MKQADFDLLLELYLDRDLGPEQHRELFDAVQSDPARKKEFLAAVDQSLRLSAGLKLTDPALYERVAYVLEKEKEAGEETVNGVLARLREERPPVGAERAPFPAWKILAPLAACLALAAGVVSYQMYQSRRFAERVVAQIEEIDPGVCIRRDDDLVAAKPGTPLARGDEIETAAGQSVSFVYAGEETRVWIAGKSVVVLEPSSQRKILFLRKGRIEANVAPQLPDAPMAVRTPHAELAVLGTVFSVTASDDTTGLNVSEGTVRIALPGTKEHEDVKEGGIAFAKAGLDRVVVPGKLVRTIRIKGLPAGTAVTGIAVAGDNVWIHGNHGPDRSTILASIDPGTGTVTRQIPAEEAFRPGSCITLKNGLLWGFSPDGKSLKGISVRSGAARRTLPVPAGETSSKRVFDIHGGVAWMRGRVRNELIKVDLGEGRILARIPCPFAIDRIAASERAVYVGESGWNACRIDPDNGGIAYRFMCEAGSVTGDMALDENSRLWAIQGTELYVHVLDAE